MSIKKIKPKIRRADLNSPAGKVVSLIRFLKDFKTINECAWFLKVNPKSVHRYLKLLPGIGFELEAKQNYRVEYRIKNLKEYFEEW